MMPNLEIHKSMQRKIQSCNADAIITTSFQELPVQLTTTSPQFRSRLLRGNVALRFSHQFISNQELTNGSRSQKRRIEVHVEVAGVDFFFRAFEWCLVDSRT